MTYNPKFGQAIKNLKADVEYIYSGPTPTNQEEFNQVNWVTGEENGNAITSTTCPHSEITWTLVQTEMNKLQSEYDAQDYARKRATEYPVTKDFMEAYTEKEIGSDSTKWDAYVINYNKVRSENPK
jgi:hypothetical protein